MIGKRRKATMKRALKKTMMLLLAFTFMLSALAMMAPLEAQASNGNIEVSIDNQNTRAPNHGAVAGSGNFGNMRVGYQVGSAANQVNPITITVINDTGRDQTLNITRESAGAGSRPNDFATNVNTLTVPRGQERSFTVRPVANLTLPAGTATRSSFADVHIRGIEAGTNVTRSVRVEFVLYQSFINTQPPGENLQLVFGDPLVANNRNVLDNRSSTTGTLPNHAGGNWRWVNVPAAGIAITTGTTPRQQQVEFTPTAPDHIMNIAVRHNVRVLVTRHVGAVTPPTEMTSIGLGQTLGESVPTAESDHTRGGTWGWVDRNGNDIRNFRPTGIGSLSFYMEFRPNVSANFVNSDGSTLTFLQRRHPVTVRVVAPTLEFRADPITVTVGDAMPALTYSTIGLMSGHQPASRPTLRLAPGINTNTVGVFHDAIIIEGGSLPSGAAADSYIGVRHVNGTLTVVAAAGAGGGGAGGDQQVGNWRREGGLWYLRNAAGQNLTGWQQEGGLWYFLHTADTRGTAPLGSMATGWLRCPSDGQYYFLRSGGDMATGWVQTGGNWFFMSGSGAMRSNEWVQSGGLWYFLGSDGAMVTGDWVQSGGHWYYVRADGAMVTGNQTIGGVRHRFASTGRWLGQG